MFGKLYTAQLGVADLLVCPTLIVLDEKNVGHGYDKDDAQDLSSV